VVLTHLAAAYQTNDLFEQAETILADLIRTDPGTATHLYNMALVKATQQKFAESLACYRKAADLDRADPRPHVKIAFILLRYPEPGKDPDAAEAVREGEIYLRLKGGEPDAEYCCLRGDAFFLRNDLKEAEAWFRRTLAIDPRCRTALQRMLNILGQKEDPTDAVQKEIDAIRKRLQDTRDQDPSGPGMDNRKRTDLTFC
jgi:tetratricopeptide (TPR) repeat protein